VRKYRVVKSDAPDALVFQSVKDGRSTRDSNILTRFLSLRRARWAWNG
jgi:hypothetical protein